MSSWNTVRVGLTGPLRKSNFQKLICSPTVCLSVAAGPKPPILRADSIRIYTGLVLPVPTHGIIFE